MHALTAIPAFTDNYIWCYRSQNGRSVVVDPGDARPVLDAVARGLDVAAILITHHHPDHIGGLPALRQQLAVPVYGPDDARIGNVDIRVGEGDVIILEGFAPSYRLLRWPGIVLRRYAF
jgi:hydroxyacylglutathione hydrolase